MDKQVIFYDNTRFNNFDLGGLDKSVVKGQFPTGCADPYIMRYNGIYYLYVTTSGLTNHGLRAWKSKDLLNWEKCQGKGLPEGYVVSPKDENGRYTQNAYAPEVYYFNGKFYMIISPGPEAVSPYRGHRILVADTPEGPFEAHSEQIDKRIDGTLLIDDDESIYFAHATPFGITIHEFKDMKELGEGALIKATDGTGAWTEGPGITKVRDFYYITYTGCHYQTPGYQVIYATTNKLDKTNIQTIADSFKRGPSRIVLLNCDKDEGHVGLGHSINFMGPDLDSYYICYHNLDVLYEDGMTHRSFNIDRLLVNHGFMTSVHNKEGSIYPHFPRLHSYNLEGFEKVKEGLYLSKLLSNKRFTCEFNSSNGGEVKYLFSYIDNKCYSYVFVDYKNKQIKVVQVLDEKENVLGESTFKYEYSSKDNHTIRIAYDGVLNVYFDNMRKVSVKANLLGGKIGYSYSNKDLVVGYSAISDEANGSSDQNEIKQALEEIPAFDYDSYQSALLNGSGLLSLEKYKSEYCLTKGMLLQKPGNSLMYDVNFKETGHYGLVLTLPKESLNKAISVSLDNEQRIKKLPKEIEAEEDIVRLFVDFGNIEKGIHRIELRNESEEFAFVSLSFALFNNDFQYENDFKKNYDGINVKLGNYYLENGELVSEGRRNFAYVSSQLLTNVSIESTIKLESVTEEKGSIGLMVRQNNYAYSDVPHQDFKDANTHIQGYYLEIKPNRISVAKYNFGDVKSYNLATIELDKSILDEYHHYEMTIVDSVIDVYMDGKHLLHTSDSLPFVVGAASIYSYRSKGRYANLKINSLNK